MYDVEAFLPQIIMMSISVAGYWVALAVVENLSSECLCRGTVEEEVEGVVDPDVLAEQAVCGRPESPAEFRILARGLQKRYRSLLESKTAVRGIDFGVEAGNIFALLGTNGAGKTTTFKMLTGELLPSEGDISLLGKDLYSNLNSLRKSIGYCPQHDPLLDLLSPREHLWLIGSIKGLKSEAKERAIDNLIDLVNIREWADVNAGELSGGNKRKLCLAMAMIGSPPVIYLD